MKGRLERDIAELYTLRKIFCIRMVIRISNSMSCLICSIHVDENRLRLKAIIQHELEQLLLRMLEKIRKYFLFFEKICRYLACIYRRT